MKRIFIILTILSFTLITMMNCSDNSSITSPDPNEETGEQPTESTEGGVAFTFTSSNAKVPGMVAYAAEVDSLPEPTNVRIIIRRYEADQNGNYELKYNTLGDVDVPTDTTMVLKVPAGVGYQIDAFSYVDSLDYYKYLLKHQLVEGIEVVADSVTQVSLTLQPIIPNFAVPDSVEKGDGFTIGVDFETFGNAPVSWQYYGSISRDTLYTDELMYYFNTSQGGQFTWESNYKDYVFNLSESELEETYLYFNTIFEVGNSEYYKSNEYTGTFKFNYPNPFLTNDTLKTYIKAPEGGVGVNVNY